MKTILSVAICVVLSVSVALAATKGEKILSDTGFFSKEYADTFLGLVKQLGKMPGGGTTTVRLTVPEPQPNIQDIRKKYGKPSKVLDEAPVNPIPKPVQVHYYGKIGFAVAKDDPAGKVGWLVAR